MTPLDTEGSHVRFSRADLGMLKDLQGRRHGPGLQSLVVMGYRS
jgi:hypothetical protein